METDKLLAKFFSGDLNDNEFNDLKALLEQNSAKRKLFDLKNEIWQETSIKTKSDYFMADKAWNEISNELGLRGQKKIYFFRRSTYISFIAAATVAFLIACGAIAYQFVKERNFNELTSAVTIVRADNGERSHVILPDSTEVLLNSDSQLEYNGRYNYKQRHVNLRGEAFFDVRTNPDKPFEVHVNDLTIVATGTKFNVYSYQDEDRIETTLVEGSISVNFKNQKPVILKEGQQIIHLAESDNLVIRDVATDVYTSWTENILRFDNTPFSEVVTKLERKYNIDIEMVSEELAKLEFTGTFIDESVEEVMSMLSLVSPINFKISFRTSENDKIYKKPKVFVWHK